MAKAYQVSWLPKHFSKLVNCFGIVKKCCMWFLDFLHKQRPVECLSNFSMKALCRCECNELTHQLLGFLQNLTKTLYKFDAQCYFISENLSTKYLTSTQESTASIQVLIRSQS